MYSNRIAGPLSPPTSPRMSGNDRKRTDSIWPVSQSQYGSYYASSGKPTSSYGAPYTASPYQSSDTMQMAQSQHGVNLPPHPTSHGNTDSPPTTVSPTQSYQQQGDRSGQAAQSASRPAFSGASYEQSSSSAHVRRSSAGPSEHSADEAELSNHDEDDDDMDQEGSDGGQGKDDGHKPPMTAAEIRQQKRKMKRFRYEAQDCRRLYSYALTNRNLQAYSQSDPVFDGRVCETSTS